MRTRLLLSSLAVLLGAGSYVGVARATSQSGFTPSTLAVGRFDDINVYNYVMPAQFWAAKLKTHGLSDVYVQSNVWAPGGTTGWHTHPGHSLIIVTAGIVTGYEGDDPTCTPHVYTEGMGFVDPGGGHVHVLRNESASAEARTIAVQLIPAAATRRIDAPKPGNCSF